MKAKDYRKEVEQSLATQSNVALESIRPTQTLQQSIATLADTSASEAARQSALDHLGAASFRHDEFASVRAEFIEALRSIAFNENIGEELRNNALSSLANENDPETQQNLRSVLGSDAEGQISKADALRLLAQDDHANAASIANELLGKSTNTEERHEAVRTLAADPAAATKLAQVFNDSSEDNTVRATAGQALRHLDASRFANEALPLVSNNNESHELRATTLTILANICDSLDDSTRQALENQLTDELTGGSALVESAARRLKECLGTRQAQSVALESMPRSSELSVTRKFDE